MDSSLTNTRPIVYYVLDILSSRRSSTRSTRLRSKIEAFELDQILEMANDEILIFQTMSSSLKSNLYQWHSEGQHKRLAHEQHLEIVAIPIKKVRSISSCEPLQSVLTGGYTEIGMVASPDSSPPSQ